MKKLDITLKDMKIINTILHQSLPNTANVLVIGSRSKNTARKFSDLDLLIDLNHASLPLVLMTKLLDTFEESDLPYKVDIVDNHTISDEFREIINKDKMKIF